MKREIEDNYVLIQFSQHSKKNIYERLICQDTYVNCQKALNEYLSEQTEDHEHYTNDSPDKFEIILAHDYYSD